MYASNLKQELKSLAMNYANKYNLNYTMPVPNSAVIFTEVQSNFYKKSFTNITNKPNWKERLGKTHPYFKSRDVKEMQSSNSSDALLMNIFCHPKMSKWKGIAQLFGQSKIKYIDFGCKPGIFKNGKPEIQRTEIDLIINNRIICEAKLTEADFTNENKKSVEAYDKFEDIFQKVFLEQTVTEYKNYQLIRNILLAEQKHMPFYLLCDARRPDIFKSFYKTVRCVKDISLRNKCNIIFWQDIIKKVGKNLKDFLAEKYGFK